MQRGLNEGIDANLLDLLELEFPLVSGLGTAHCLGLADARLALCREVAIAVLHTPAEIASVERLLLPTNGTGTIFHIPE